ncbi:VOC family protein [Stappia sp. F7233]|uniref:VOC family protein n=1 Tax=Stappia albiluteola TaxID=2758565 RepID=A0A839A975_9HYPH|nr:VOC family protein [Stappia albiluteola]MBA5775891.1 VOC family protein [Stappia albiluteola]
MPIVDHLSVGVPNIAEARKFYDPVMETVGANCLAASDGFAAYGKDRVEFIIILPFDGNAPTGGNGTHIALVAAAPAAVDAAYRAALANGGTDEGAPGPREGYPIPNVYTGYVRDPFGNKLEVIHNGFAG